MINLLYIQNDLNLRIAWWIIIYLSKIILNGANSKKWYCHFRVKSQATNQKNKYRNRCLRAPFHSFSLHMNLVSRAPRVRGRNCTFWSNSTFFVAPRSVSCQQWSFRMTRLWGLANTLNWSTASSHWTHNIGSFQMVHQKKFFLIVVTLKHFHFWIKRDNSSREIICAVDSQFAELVPQCCFGNDGSHFQRRISFSSLMLYHTIWRSDNWFIDSFLWVFWNAKWKNSIKS